MSVISDEMKSMAWNHLASISDQTQTSSVLANKWFEPAHWLQRFAMCVIDWWAENKLPLSTPIISDFPAWGRGHWGQRWRIYFPISVQWEVRNMSSQRRRRKKGRHCALLSRVQFRQSSCLTGFWHEGQSSNNPVLAAPVIECYPQVPGSTDHVFWLIRFFSSDMWR